MGYSLACPGDEAYTMAAVVPDMLFYLFSLVLSLGRIVGKWKNEYEKNEHKNEKNQMKLTGTGNARGNWTKYKETRAEREKRTKQEWIKEMMKKTKWDLKPYFMIMGRIGCNS